MLTLVGRPSWSAHVFRQRPILRSRVPHLHSQWRLISTKPPDPGSSKQGKQEDTAGHPQSEESVDVDFKDGPATPKSTISFTNGAGSSSSSEETSKSASASSIFQTRRPLPFKLPYNLDLESLRIRFRTWSLKGLTNLRVRMDDFSSAAKVTFQQLGGRLNEVTGYQEIEMLKRKVVENEQKMFELKEAAKAAKQSYEDAIARRSSSQRETNDLLQRKSTWSDSDVLRFTQLVRQDHNHEQEEIRAQHALAAADSASEQQFATLMRSILDRYHEEQVWSDKIRSASTYGQLAALGLNLAVFVLAIILVEPWKRKRLVQSFEQRMVELNNINQQIVEDGLKEIKEEQDKHLSVLAQLQATQAMLFSNINTTPKPAPVLINHDNEEVKEEAGEEIKATSVALEFDKECTAKAARDRQLFYVAATAAGTGIVGFILGTFWR